MPTIYQSTPGPWKQGGRTVENFRSGLIKVTQDYMCKTETAVADTPAVGSEMDSDGTGSLDGVYVYPEPQRTDNGNGFTTIRVTGYGRLFDTYIVEPRLVDGTFYDLTVTDGELTASIETTYQMTSFVCRYVIATGGASLLDFSTLKDQFKMYNGDGSVASPYGGGNSNTTLAQTFSLQDSNYFGDFTEFVTVVSYTPTRTTTVTT